MERLGQSLVSVFVLVGLVPSVFNFNFDTNFTIIYDNPGDAGEHFGYSVILYEGDGKVEPWIQIGAPKAKTGRNNLETGDVYRCGIKSLCSPLSMPIVATIPGAALGNTMDLSPDGKIFTACGHRWIKTSSNDYYAQGFCHWGRSNENTTVQKVPFEDKQSTTKRAGKSVYNFGQGQAGFAAHFTIDQDRTQLIVGAPGVLNWAGLTFLWRGDDSSGPTAARRFKRASESLSELLIPNSEETPVPDLSLFGYSVTAGKFMDTKTMYYAAGAPRVDMIGKVFIFQVDDNGGIKKARELEEREYGKYYGGSLATANLNGDKFDDLIVGAPTFKSSQYDEGKIFIYYGPFLDSKTEIEGKQPGGQFGDSIASLGDMDFDGYEDIAVAAPYEDGGRGAVYIYRGSENGIINNPTQVIKGRSFEPHLSSVRGFGHSIARSRDIDKNSHNDLAIGAYKSEHVFIFRARPVITLHHELQEDKIVIDAKDTKFNFTSCVYYKTNKPFTAEPIVVTPKFVIDPWYKRATLTEQPSRIALDMPGKPVCRVYNVQLKDLDNRSEIKYTLTLKLEEPTFIPDVIRVKKDAVSGTDNFCAKCPVLDPKTPKEWENRLADFHLGCGDDNICDASLHITSSFKGIDNDVFTIGSKHFLTLVTEVTNTGEKAYRTELSIMLPSSPKVSLRSVPPICRENNDTFITCLMADPLEENAKKSIELELDMDKINAGNNTQLGFNVSVSTNSVNNRTSFMALALYAKKMANITITGRSKEKYYQFDNTSSVVEFAQVLQIQKQGPSSIDDVEIHLLVPMAFRNVGFLEMYAPTLAPKGQPIKCGSSINFIEKDKMIKSVVGDVDNDIEKTRRKRSAEDVTEKFQHFTGFYVNCTDKLSPDLECETLHCNTGIVNKDVIEIQFKFRMNISKIPRDVLGESDVLVIGSTFKANIKDDSITSPSTSDFLLPSVLVGPNVQKMVPLWIIIVAVLSGILVLAIIAAVLYKFGFFKRTQKEKLKEEMKAENEATEALNLTDNDDE